MVTGSLEGRGLLRTGLPLVRVFLQITVGVLLLALGNVLFLIPNKVFSGGATGLAIVINSFVPVPVGIVVLLINVPLVIAGVVWLGGWRFLVRTTYAVIIYSILLDALTPFFSSVTTDPLLYTLYGGLMSGTGVGLVFRAQGTTGGDDIGGQLLNKFTGIPVNGALVIINAGIFGLVGLTFGPEKALYALISAFASGQAVRFVQEGFRSALLLHIISTAPYEIAVKIQEATGRGVTFLQGSGAYTGREYHVILTAVRQQELSKVTELVREVDPHAFIIVNESREVMGHGFKDIPVPPERVSLPVRLRGRAK
jgi:uncharacterized membrane-anchored protein YitT (DUF2179 family)